MKHHLRPLNVTAIMSLLLTMSVMAATTISDHWAVLVAGSKGFYNYRHQSDVCHAYHLLVQQGIPAE